MRETAYACLLFIFLNVLGTLMTTPQQGQNDDLLAAPMDTNQELSLDVQLVSNHPRCYFDPALGYVVFRDLRGRRWEVDYNSNLHLVGDEARNTPNNVQRVVAAN